MKFIGEWNLENKLWTLGVLIGTEVLSLLGPLRARKQTHIHTHIYEIYIYITGNCNSKPTPQESF